MQEEERPRGKSGSRRSLGGSLMLAGGGGNVGMAAQKAPGRRMSMARQSIKFGENVSLESEEDSAEVKEKQQKMLTNYQTIVQLSAENKITKSNAWNLNLIENIHSVLASLKGSFPKAGSALEASVDIYEKKVDSIHTDTFKMFENVNRTGADQPSQQKDKSNASQEEDEEDEGGGDDGDGNTKQKKIKLTQNNFNSTIEKNLAKLDLTVDREFEIDPLFRKMSKAFDEGGAKGMLLNVLGSHDGCAVVFDTSVAVAFPDTSTESSANDENVLMDSIQIPPSMRSIPGIPICPSLSNLRVGANKKYESVASRAPPLQIVEEEKHDECPYDDYYEGGGGGGDGGFDDDNNDEGDGVPSSGFGNSSSEYGDEASSNRFSLFSSNRTSSSARNGAEVEVQICFTGQGNGYSYFDPSKFSSHVAKLRGGGWAGATHWKVVRSQLPSFERTQDGEDDDDESLPETRGKKEKSRGSKRKVSTSKTTINFRAPIKIKVPKLSQSSSSLSASEKRKSIPGNKFPIDLHYTINQLQRLFLKPEAYVTVVRSVSGDDGNETSVSQRENSVIFSDGGGAGFDGGGNDFDDDDSPGDFLATGPPEEGANLVSVGRKVEKISINFATRAKKVDVKKLKATMWEYIESHAEYASPQHEQQENPTRTSRRRQGEVGSIINSTANDPDVTKGDNNKPLSLGDTVRALAPHLASNITVPFYFICALHLANEKGLRFIPQEGMKDFGILRELETPQSTEDTTTSTTDLEGETIIPVEEKEEKEEKNDRVPAIRKQTKATTKKKRGKTDEYDSENESSDADEDDLDETSSF